MSTFAIRVRCPFPAARKNAKVSGSMRRCAEVLRGSAVLTTRALRQNSSSSSISGASAGVVLGTRRVDGDSDDYAALSRRAATASSSTCRVRPERDGVYDRGFFAEYEKCSCGDSLLIERSRTAD